MADINSFPNNQDEYVGAENLMRWFHGRTSGVFGARNNCTVKAVDGEMSVTVTDGTGWLSNESSDGIVWWVDHFDRNGSELKLNVDLADGVLSRIDRVVISWETTNYVARPTINVLKGDLASQPIPPSLTNNNVMRQISLAQISVPAGTLSITPSLITDERLDGSVCGLVSESIEADTIAIQAQVESVLAETKAQTDTLIESILNELESVSGVTGFDLAPIRAKDVVINPERFQTFVPGSDEEQRLFDAGYGYRASVPIENVLSNMFPYVTFSIPVLENSEVNVANQFQTYNGGIYMYSDDIPKNGILALTIECRKAVG